MYLNTLLTKRRTYIFYFVYIISVVVKGPCSLLPLYLAWMPSSTHSCAALAKCPLTHHPTGLRFNPRPVLPETEHLATISDEKARTNYIERIAHCLGRARHTLRACSNLLVDPTLSVGARDSWNGMKGRQLVPYTSFGSTYGSFRNTDF
jgi:hypothetical protein